MVKRRAEDDGLDTGFRERSRPAEDQAADRLRDLRDRAANDQTRIFWQVVMSDMVHLNRLVLQNQQTRALPEWQQGSGSRTVGYARQVEVAAGKLVMAARKLMCKELGAGARCRHRKAAANQITALRYISEAVGVKSFERATTELRKDLDTPALAEALKTSERKLQISEQRVATLEASLTRH